MENIVEKKIIKGDWLIFLAMLMFGGYSLFLRLFPDIPAISFLFAFQVVGAISFFAALCKQGFPKLGRQGYLLLASLAAAATLNDLSYFLAFRLTTIANAAIAHQMVSVFLLFLAPWLIKELTKKNEWVALSVAILGIVVLYGGGTAIASRRDFLGITLALLSAAFYALIIILYKDLPRRGLTISAINFWRYTMSAAMLFPVMFGFGGFNLKGADMLPLLAFGLLFAFVASGIHNFGVSQTRALHASILGKTEPAVATIYAFLFLKEVPPLASIVGGALIIGSSLWLALRNET